MVYTYDVLGEPIMPTLNVFCPASQNRVTLTLSMQRRPETCQCQITCKKAAYIKCLLKAQKITEGR
jgi:hypothetical protein